MRFLCVNLIIVLVGFSHLALSQNSSFKSAINQLQAGYPDLLSLEIVMDLKVLETRESSKPYYQDQIKIQKQGDNFLYQYAQTEMLVNEEYQIIIDHENKMMALQRLDKSSRTKLKPFQSLNLDSILNFYEEPVLEEKNGAVIHYSVKQKNQLIDQVDLFIDTEKNYIKKITYDYPSGEYVTIDFTVFKKNPSLNKEIFSQKRYIKTEKGKISGVGKFENYFITGNILEE